MGLSVPRDRNVNQTVHENFTSPRTRCSKESDPQTMEGPLSPTERSWFCRINDIYYAEQLRFMGEEGEGGFKLKWQDWVNFKLSSRYIDRMI